MNGLELGARDAREQHTKETKGIVAPCPLPCWPHHIANIVRDPETGHPIASDCELCGQRVSKAEWQQVFGGRL